MSSSEFGFTVEYHEAQDEDEQSGWSVYLPHQCDNWDIDSGSWWQRSTQADALARLDLFIAEAQAARDALARGEQHGKAS